MDTLVKFVTDHPLSFSTIAVTPLVIPSAYHVVISQLLLQFGIFGIEWLYKKVKIRNRRKNLDQSFDDYLDDKNPTEIR